MKKYLYLLAPIMLVVLVYGWMQLHPARPVAAQPKNITMLPPTIKVPTDINNSVVAALERESGRLDVTTFAVTGLSARSGYTYVSVAGFPAMRPGQYWNLDSAIWIGNVVVKDSSAVVATIPNDAITQQPLHAPGPEQTGRGGGTAFLPFASGSTAQYGIAGVHDCGFSLNGWKAVDLFPSSNMVYSSLGGEVNYVCRDGTQVALRIGNNLYDHLVDTGQQIGDKYTQGQALGSLVPGTFNTACGYASQNADAYHVHFCFIPDGGNYYADGYTLSMASQTWTKGAENVAVGGTLTAAWTDANGNPVPSPTGGANFWDYAIGGVTGALGKVLPAFPTHQAMGMADNVIRYIKPPLDLAYTLILVNFDMTIPLWVIGIIFTLEAVRLIYAGYMWIKRAIPLIG